jgi:hypothetical protein
MSDTVSAATSAGVDDGGLTFITTASAGIAGSLHVPGGVQAEVTPPTLIVQFTTLTPDFQGLLPDPLFQPTDTGAAIYVLSVPSDLDSVIVDFSGS